MITSWTRPKIRTRVVALAMAATLGAAGTVTLTPAGPAVAAAGVENEGADCAVPGLPDAGSLPTAARLPDPFRKLDGTRISAKSDWRCRREEIKRLAEKFVYGEKPAKPSSVTGTVSRTGITVNVSHNGRSASFSAGVDLPSGSGPFPAVVVLGGLGADTATIKAAGAAVISYDPLAVGREGTPRTSKQGAFYTLYGASSGTGVLAAWAWGVSRIIDVIEQAGGAVLRADGTGVTGCSRYGKGAFVTGAFDQRIALTMPIEPGSGGVAAFRAIPGESGAQPLSSAYSEQPWLGDAFGSFTGSPARLPVDTHSVVGMIAPRGLFIMDNPHIDWLAARSASVGALGGAEVYKALGAGGNITYWSDVQDGTHCATRSEWRTPLQQNIQKFLLNTGSSTGTMRVSPAKSGNLAEWRDWQTPALGDTGGDTTAPSAPGVPVASGVTATSATLTWPASTDQGGSGLAGYDVLRAPGASGGTFTRVGASATTSYADTGLTPATTYRYQVVARDAAGNTSPLSGAVTVTTQPGSSAGACSAVATVQTQWATGYVIQPLTVTNTGTATITGWTVTFTLPAGHALAGSWNGAVTSSGQTVTIRNVAHNGTLAPGAATGGVGFQVNRPNGDTSLPSGYTCA
ncbi:glucuronyl esterase domain-containing protein [Nonomuraea candida]|uniref:glucuronyl esterase domain-containing protein n=1 Tax=Nonomuraea candida TaxID=359159 RepID=UPI000A9F1EC7|nr:cellulose binding domain-containing protein [Nonomuraea candida]